MTERRNRFAIAIAMLLALAALSPVATAQKQATQSDPPSASRDSATTTIAAFVAAHVSELKGDTVAVLPFTHVDGVKSVEGIIYAQRLTAALTTDHSVHVVERTLLDHVLAEQKLAALGFVDPATGVKMGKLLSASGLVMGTVADAGEKLELAVRIVSTQTGEVIASTTCAAPRTVKTFISPLWEEIDRIKAEGKSFEVTFWADHGQGSQEVPRYREGEFVTLYFQADRDCYVTIFDFTTSGSIHVLFPNAFHKDNKVKADRIYAVPEPDGTFRIRVSGPPGIEQLKLFATTADTPLFTEDYSVETFRSVTPDLYSVPRDLNAVLKELGSAGWAESELEFQIEPVLRMP